MSAGGTPHDPTAYHRYIEVLDSDATTHIAVLSDRNAGVSLCKSAEFELLRQGGCGGGSFTLLSRFPYNDISNGMYIRCKFTSDGDPVYLGRVEEITVDSPSTVSIRTQGPMSLLNGIRVGGFNSEDQRLPHLYAASDYFIDDPDWNLQSWDYVDTVPGLIQTLYDQYISIRTSITLGTIYSYPPEDTVPFNSSVFRGQETLGPLIRALAMQQNGASYGVDANNQFFFIPQNTTELAYFQEGMDLFKLQSSRDLSLMFNELHITGDYVYDLRNQNKLYKFYSTHASASSIAAYGPRRTLLYQPWIRTRADADAFARAFFAIYGNATTRYNLTTVAQGAALVPWEGTVGLKDRDGVDIVRAEPFDRIEFQWDHAPIPSLTLGPEDLMFPQSPVPDRWPLANRQIQEFSFESISYSDSSESSSSSSSESSSNDCNYCPDGLQDSIWSVTLPNPCNGSATEWDLVNNFSSGCVWTQTQAGITARLQWSPSEGGGTWLFSIRNAFEPQPVYSAGAATPSAAAAPCAGERTLTLSAGLVRCTGLVGYNPTLSFTPAPL